MPEGHDATIEVCNIMSFVLYTQILKQSVLKPASPGITLNEHLDMQHTIGELAKSASRALCALQSKFSFPDGMTFEVFDRLYKALVEPVMYYGSAIWGTLNCAKLDAVQARAC